MTAEEIESKLLDEARNPLAFTILLHQRMYYDPPPSREMLIFWCGILCAMVQQSLPKAHDR